MYLICLPSVGVRVSCPDDIHSSIDEGSTKGTITWKDPDVFGGLNQVHVNGSHQTGDALPVGLHVVEYVVHDPDMNHITSCNFSIYVYGIYVLRL